MRSFAHLFVAALAAPVMLFSASALAADPCGKFAFDANGNYECHVEVSGGCTAHCEPLEFTAACTGQCNVTVDVDCSATCQASCMGGCSGGMLPSCEADCSADCEATCKGNCMGNTCAGDCKASCSGHCGVACEDGSWPSCDVACKAECDGSCSGSVDATCQASCYGELKGGCEAQCSEPTGAIFCNGQYVGSTDVQSCIDYLAAQFNIKVSASAECKGNTCTAKASCSACNVGSSDQSETNYSAIGAVVAGLGIAVARRRKSNKKS
jgi:hypothetical protein